jgi:hypothetical protein
MAITQISNVSAGNALRIYVAPPAGAAYWSLLRRTDANFTAVDDPDAVVILSNSKVLVPLDYTNLTNGTEYFYCDFAWNGTEYVMGVPVSGTPNAGYQVGAVDVQEFVRERLELGLAVEVAAGRLFPQTGLIPVVTAPYALIDGITFPCVSVHLENDSPGQRSVGESQFGEIYLGGIGWDLNEGWLASTRLNIVGVSLNGDERIALRKAIKRVVQENLTVFNEVGFVNISLNQVDGEMFTEDQANLFLTNGTFECDAPSYVTTAIPTITTITTDLTYSTSESNYG